MAMPGGMGATQATVVLPVLGRLDIVNQDAAWPLHHTHGAVRADTVTARPLPGPCPGWRVTEPHTLPEEPCAPSAIAGQEGKMGTWDGRDGLCSRAAVMRITLPRTVADEAGQATVACR